MTNNCFEEFKKWAATAYDGPIRPALTSQSMNGMDLDNLQSDSLWKGWKAAWLHQEERHNNAVPQSGDKEGRCQR